MIVLHIVPPGPQIATFTINTGSFFHAIKKAPTDPKPTSLCVALRCGYCDIKQTGDLHYSSGQRGHREKGCHGNGPLHGCQNCLIIQDHHHRAQRGINWNRWTDWMVRLKKKIIQCGNLWGIQIYLGYTKLFRLHVSWVDSANEYLVPCTHNSFTCKYVHSHTSNPLIEGRQGAIVPSGHVSFCYRGT